MERRQRPRKSFRTPVRFWERGAPEQQRRGFTTDISLGGVHVSTGTPFPSRTRLRIEVGPEDKAFVVDGVVTHSHRVAPELRQVGLGGMGVRFVPVEELVTELVGPPLSADGSDAGVEADADGPDFELRFNSPERFLHAVRNDVAHGGLFVPTDAPAPLASAVTIEVVPPGSSARPVRLRARVVHRVEPAAGGQPANVTAGMGVQLDDPAGARAALAQAAEAVEDEQRTSS